MKRKFLLLTTLLLFAASMSANSEVYLTKDISYATATESEVVSINSTNYTVAGTYTLTTLQAPNTNYDYTVLSVAYADLTTALGTNVNSSSARAMFCYPKSDGTYQFNQSNNWYTGSGYYCAWSDADARFYIEDNHATTVADNFSFYVGQHQSSGKTSSIGDTYTTTFYCVADGKAVRFVLTLTVGKQAKRINSADTDLSWTSTSSTTTISAGDYVQLSGMKMTLGNVSDPSTTWTWHSGNSGMIPTQMPTTDGTSATLITSFSAESPYGTLPTRGNFFKVEATESGLLTVFCKPSTDAAQSLVFVEMTGSGIAKATVNGSIWDSYYNYNVEAGKTYYIFQLSKSGNLTGYRYTLRGISFQSQILSENAAYTPANMVGITALTLQRTITADKWSTIVLPVALTNAQLTAAFGANVKVAELNSVSENTLSFASVTATEANKPYMIKTDADFSEATITGITVVDGTPSQTVGTVTFTGSYNASTDIPKDAYFVSDNKVVKAGTGCTMKGTRAYFTVSNGAKARTLNFVVDGDEATGIKAIANEQVTKNNVQLYNLAGQRVDAAYKGIVIKNGKKYLNK